MRKRKEPESVARESPKTRQSLQKKLLPKAIALYTKGSQITDAELQEIRKVLALIITNGERDYV